MEDVFIYPPLHHSRKNIQERQSDQIRSDNKIPDLERNRGRQGKGIMSYADYIERYRELHPDHTLLSEQIYSTLSMLGIKNLLQLPYIEDGKAITITVIVTRNEEKSHIHQAIDVLNGIR